MESYAIVYSSNTGNTEQLAQVVQRNLPKDLCVYFGRPNLKALEAKRIYLGFWTDQGTADASIVSFLKNVKNKELFLFGTAGFDGNGYFQDVLDRVQMHVDKSNVVFGTFMCQGKMPTSVRERYVEMKAKGVQGVEAWIENFDKALSHPDAHDLQRLQDRL